MIDSVISLLVGFVLGLFVYWLLTQQVRRDGQRMDLHPRLKRKDWWKDGN